MREDRGEVPRGRRGRLRVVFTAAGLLATALATTYVIKTGATATTGTAGTVEGTPRTVIATVGPDTPKAAPQTITLDQAAALERPVRISVPAAAPAQTDLRKVVYTVAGNQRPDDPVTVIYADETGTLQRLDNVVLPWTLTVTPNLPVNYVTASSRGSQINCWITDAAGTTVASATEFSPSATCNR